MLEDKSILRLCLAVSIIGIVLLVVATGMITPLDVPIGKIDTSLVGNNVKIAGRVDRLAVNDGNIFAAVNDSTGVMDVVVFERTARAVAGVYDIKKGDNVSVAGKIDYYQTRIELVASAIEQI
jgi:RecJ-like exonuclease